MIRYLHDVRPFFIPSFFSFESASRRVAGQDRPSLPTRLTAVCPSRLPNALRNTPAQAQTGIPGSEYSLVKPFGSCDDEVCFEEEQSDFIAAVDTLDANQSGYDGSFEESQTIALVRAAEDWAWRDGVLKVSIGVPHLHDDTIAAMERVSARRIRCQHPFNSVHRCRLLWGTGNELFPTDASGPHENQAKRRNRIATICCLGQSRSGWLTPWNFLASLRTHDPQPTGLLLQARMTWPRLVVPSSKLRSTRAPRSALATLDAVHFQVLAITTDAGFHVPETSGDEYFALEEVIDACNSKSIKVTASSHTHAAQQ